jgi:hypothetical protein
MFLKKGSFFTSTTSRVEREIGDDTKLHVRDELTQSGSCPTLGCLITNAEP